MVNFSNITQESASFSKNPPFLKNCIMSFKTKISHIRSIFSKSINALRQNSIIFLPFAIIAFLELLGLEILYFSSRFPLSIIFGPPIRRLFGESYLHYPFNFIIIPKLQYNLQVVISIFLGGLLTAALMHMVYRISQVNQPNFKVSLKAVFKNYFTFLLIISLTLFLFFTWMNLHNLVLKKLLVLKLGKIFKLFIKAWIISYPFINFFFAILIQSLLVFAIPVAIVKEGRFFKALKEGLVFLKGRFVITFLLILLPSLVYFPIIILKNNLGILMDKTFPEMTLWVIGLGSILSLFVETFISTCIITYYLNDK